MRNSIAAMRRLIALSAIVTVPVMSVGCTNCNTAATTTCAKPVAVRSAPTCSTPTVYVQPIVYRQAAPQPAPVVYTAATPAYRSGPVCGGDVALDGSVIRDGQIVFDGTAATRAAYGAPYAPLYATTYMTQYNQQQQQASAKKVVALPGGTGEVVRVGKPVRKARPVSRPAPKAVVAAPAAPAPVAVTARPESTLVPTAVGAQDVTALATVSDVYTVTPGQTYTVLPAQTAAAVVSPVIITAPQPAPQQSVGATGSSVRVLGPAEMSLSAAELDNYSKTDVYEAPPQPAPVPPPVIPGAGTCAPEVVQQGLCPSLY